MTDCGAWASSMSGFLLLHASMYVHMRIAYHVLRIGLLSALVGRRGRAQLTLAAESSPSVIVQVPLAEEGRQEVMQRRKRQQKHLCLQPSEAQLFKCCVCSQSSLWQGLPLMMGVQYGMTCKAE